MRAGVYSNGYDASLNVKNGFPVFTTVIEANFVNRQEDRFAAFKLSDEDKQEILKLARDPRIGEWVAEVCLSPMHKILLCTHHLVVWTGCALTATYLLTCAFAGQAFKICMH